MWPRLLIATLFIVFLACVVVSLSRKDQCPRCKSEQTRLSRVGFKSLRQLLEGFTICRECEAEFYVSGKLRTSPATLSTVLWRLSPPILVQIVTALLLVILFNSTRAGNEVLPVAPAIAVWPSPPPVLRVLPLGPVVFDPITGRAIAPVPSGMTREEFDRLATPELP